MTNASLAALAQVNVPLALSLKVTASTKSTLTSASIAALALVFALLAHPLLSN
jgi:hypothetical protein